MVSAKLRVAVCPLESVAVMLRDKGEGELVGVPEINPVAESNVNPLAGRLGVDQVTAPTLPLESNCVE